MSSATLWPDINLTELTKLMLAKNVTQLLFKELAPNDNSKNQIYLGKGLEVINILPMGEISGDQKSTSILKAPLPLFWLHSSGAAERASASQLILYPQYPETRISGFLKKTQFAPSHIMASREPGRVLFLGITNNRQIIAWAAAASSKLANEVRGLTDLERTGTLKHLPIGTADTSRQKLVNELTRIHRLGWIESRRLKSDGIDCPCYGTNCGGLTLEAQLGIRPNANAEPDFEGWEIKAHAVEDFERPATGALTLMTPQPTGGIYQSLGVITFVNRYGYKDKSGRDDRLNFSSPHRFGVRNANTGLTLTFLGFDIEKLVITDASGGFALIDDQGNEAAIWHFANLMNHWNKKHAKAAYVPYTSLKIPSKQQYHYGNRVRLGETTDFIRFLGAIAAAKVVYDPGIKLENASTSSPKAKHRNQFRIASSSLGALYRSFDAVEF